MYDSEWLRQAARLYTWERIGAEDPDITRARGGAVRTIRGVTSEGFLLGNQWLAWPSDPVIVEATGLVMLVGFDGDTYVLTLKS